MLSDEQIIQNIRRDQRLRRPLGFLFAILGLTGVALVGYWTHDRRAQALSTFEDLSRTPHPTTQQADRALDESRFTSGFALGSLCAAGLAGTLPLAVHGLIWVFVRSRRDLLLLKLWEQRPPEHRQRADATARALYTTSPSCVTPPPTSSPPPPASC
jgi:hypothetical protein